MLLLLLSSLMRSRAAPQVKDRAPTPVGNKSIRAAAPVGNKSIRAAGGVASSAPSEVKDRAPWVFDLRSA